jgi:hypothetical protein
MGILGEGESRTQAVAVINEEKEYFLTETDHMHMKSSFLLLGETLASLLEERVST